METENTKWHLVPEHLQGGLKRWIDNGVPPGHFLTAVLQNDLMEAVGRADEKSAYALRNICVFLYNYAPPACFGSPEAVDSWFKRHKEIRNAAQERID